MKRSALAAALVAAGVSSFAWGATARPRKTPAPRRINFSGTWRLDPKLSINVSPRMERAILTVNQNGDRIWIEPERPKTALLAEEIVVDGKPYEKSLGNGGTGIVTAAWADDGRSLRLEITAGDVVQRSIWKLSSDGSVWVRETNTIDHGARRSSRLVFRKEMPGKRPTPARQSEDGRR